MAAVAPGMFTQRPEAGQRCHCTVDTIVAAPVHCSAPAVSCWPTVAVPVTVGPAVLTGRADWTRARIMPSPACVT